MGEALNSKRNVLYDNVLKCAPEEFDAQWEEYMTDYLTSGGQAIIDERTEAWEKLYGDKVTLE